MEFRHTPDDVIFVDDFRMTLAEFLTQEPDYPGLPVGIRNFEYFQAGHVLHNEGKSWAQKPNGDAASLSLEPALLDGYISKKDLYVAAFVSTLVPEPSLSPADQAEAQMKNDPNWRAWVKWQAKKENKTPRQIMDELMDELMDDADGTERRQPDGDHRE